MAQESLFDDARADQDELLVSAYVRVGRTLDDLPYTPQFEQLCQALGVPAGNDGRHALLHRLQNLRKASALPRLGEAREAPPRIAPEQEALLTRLVEAAVGRLSLRDQLPYTAQFDELVARFNTEAGMTLSPHDAWRIIAKLAK